MKSLILSAGILVASAVMMPASPALAYVQAYRPLPGFAVDRTTGSRIKMAFAYCTQQGADRILQGQFKEPLDAFRWTHNCMTIYGFEWVGWIAPNNQIMSAAGHRPVTSSDFPAQ